MKPVIALVGRPNVGKSTLFNKLTKTRDALVADFPGLTRDRQYGDGRVGGFDYLLIDTGGLSGEPETLDAAMADQTLQAVVEADLVVFLVDGRDGSMSIDEDIADVLRRMAKPVLLCVNKTDGIGEQQAQLDFYALGFEHMASVAAAHNRGLGTLMGQAAGLLNVAVADEAKRKSRKERRKQAEEAEALKALAEAEQSGVEGEASDTQKSNDADPFIERDVASGELRIAFVGRPNVGKSTLINRLVGDERVIAYDQPGTTRDSVHVPFSQNGKDYTLVDTAGVRRRGKVSETVEKFSIIKTLQAIDDSNVCVMLLDAQDGVTEQDLHLLGHIIEKGRALVVAVNKWDSLSPEERDNVKDALERRVEFLKFTRIHFISALKGSGVNDLFKSVNRAYASAFAKFQTPRLTRLLEVAVQQHQPPLKAGRRIKLRYAHQGGMNPPVIVVHGTQASKTPMAYQRYLVNQYMKSLHLFGTPLRLELRDGENPFAKKKKRVRPSPVKDKKGSGRGSAGDRK